MPKAEFRMKIYGVRGSYPPTNGFATHFGVNTTCIRFDIGKHLIVFDAGTGIINLGNDLLKEIKNGNSRQNLWKIHLFFTHLHIDHLMGFPYFSMIYIPQTELHLISPRILVYSLKDSLEMLMSPALFPVTMNELPSRKIFHDLAENRVVFFLEDDFQIVHVTDAPSVKNWIGKISCIRNYTHPKGGTYIYKVEFQNNHSVVFATDVEGFVGGDQRIINFARGADILIHDAQYTLREYEMFQGFGHSTYEMACEIAKKAEVKKLLLFHHDPKHDDAELSELEMKAREIFPETYMASENMEFNF
ncbi:MAG: MBL fold metallo-hydrolase [Calditrichaeota bacterium]|nr:MBL fold metallo-hydrolase [Calditrichota bacterium]